VKKGDVLFVIDPRPFQAEANRAEAAAGRPAPKRIWPVWNCPRRKTAGR
jgi:multidrug efflux pump subunit AcrA (membrane-fusion protein)